MIDHKTTNLQLPLPHEQNLLEDDVPRLRAAFELLDAAAAQLDAGLQTKAEAAALRDSLAEITTKLGNKADADALHDGLTDIATKLGSKADASTVASDFAQKADKEETKAALAQLVERLEGKVDSTDQRLTPLISTATLATTWVGDAPPYTQTLTISGVTGSGVVEITLPSTATAEEITAYQALQWTDGGQTEGEVTLKAWGETNAIDIPVTVIVRV